VPALAIQDEGRRAVAAPRRPGLAVELTAGVERGPESTALRVRVDVGGGQGGVRLYLYVDGDLVESWVLSSSAPRFAPPSLGLELSPGRHAVTARAIDATGRWGGASTILELGAERALA
jgi:hypothetical protein